MKRQRVASAAPSTPPQGISKTELAQTWAAEMRAGQPRASKKEPYQTWSGASSDGSPIAEALAARRFLAP
jgi:hypothetical protein